MTFDELLEVPSLLPPLRYKRLVLFGRATFAQYMIECGYPMEFAGKFAEDYMVMLFTEQFEKAGRS